MNAALPQQAGDPRWYVVQTRHLSETRAAQELVNQGFEVFLPRYLKKRRHARRVSMVALPLFPSYLFVAFDKERQRWRAVNGTYGVARIIAGEDGPLPISGGIVAALRARLNPKGFIDLSARPDFTAGEVVRINAGSFVDTLGLFEGFRDKDRVAVLLDLFGSKVRVVLGEELVEKAA